MRYDYIHVIPFTYQRYAIKIPSIYVRYTNKMTTNTLLVLYLGRLHIISPVVNFCSFHVPVKQIFCVIFCDIFATPRQTNFELESFRYTLWQNFNWIRQQTNNFPIDPHCSYRSLSATLAIFIMGICRNLLDDGSTCYLIEWNLPQSLSKTFQWSIRSKFYWAWCNKNIA